MKIKIEDSKTAQRKLCLSCWDWFKHFHVAPVVYDNSREVGYMCPECLKAGSSGIREKLRIKTNNLREKAESLDRMASQKIQVPVFDEYEEKLKEREKEYETEFKLQPSVPSVQFTGEGLPF